jgi:dynein heavy chain
MNEDLTVSRRQLKIFIEKYDFVPYKVLNYVGAEINYGGRVTDSQDKILISNILKTYMNDNIVKDGHAFSESGLYNSIPVGEKEDYLEYIRSLPLNPKPEAFGLHENAEITTSQLEVLAITENMLSMQPRTSAGKGKTREEVIMDLAKFLESKTRPVFDFETVSKKFPTDYNESMNTVIVQECVRYNGLLEVMKVTLA